MATEHTADTSATPRTESGDVVEMILEDHRLFESLDRARIGVIWLAERNRMLDEGCGILEQVRALLDAS